MEELTRICVWPYIHSYVHVYKTFIRTCTLGESLERRKRETKHTSIELNKDTHDVLSTTLACCVSDLANVFFFIPPLSSYRPGLFYHSSPYENMLGAILGFINPLSLQLTGPRLFFLPKEAFPANTYLCRDLFQYKRAELPSRNGQKSFQN